MNILITGGQGFVGRHLAHHLEILNDVYCYDLKSGNDIRNLHDLDKAFELSQCTTVIHLAALAGVRRSKDYASEYISTNITGTWNVGLMCEKYGCNLISFSSSSVYGNANPPTKEDDPKDPVSIYGMTKLCAEQIVNRLNIQTTTIRPFTIYGENGRGDQVFYKWLNQFKSQKNITVYRGSETTKRGYTYVGDIVSAILYLVETDWPWEHEDFNLGGKEIITIDELVYIFSQNIPGFDALVGYLPPPKEDIAINYADITKAQNMIGFNPLDNFTQNLEQIILTEIGE